MIDEKKLKKIYKDSLEKTRVNLSEFAFKNEDAYRLKDENSDFLRSDFAIDRDRILYSGAYRRYQGKTQVFSFTNFFDEEMTNRSTHTTYVSQISRTIGKRLNLNLELIEAIALGHDLGHSPFGHDGEVALSECCRSHGIGMFHHNIQSLQVTDYIAKGGTGLNLTFQVRDGIISHDGEVHNKILQPQKDKTEKEVQEFIEQKKTGIRATCLPATLEGCVVRISDTIAYIGQDIEDAIRYQILRPEDLPKDCTDYLGNSNGEIIDTLVKSVVVNSYDENHVSFDDETSEYLFKLKKFNYAHIYTNPDIKRAKFVIKNSIEFLFEIYLNDIKNENKDSLVFKQFLNRKHKSYHTKFSDEEKVRDFIATMTDRYFNEEVKKHLLPGKNL
jgi:dGTPase